MLACGRQEGELRVLSSDSTGLLEQLSCHAMLGTCRVRSREKWGQLECPQG